MNNTIEKPINFFQWTKEADYSACNEIQASKIRCIYNKDDDELRLTIDHPSNNGSIASDVFNGSAIKVIFEYNTDAERTWELLKDLELKDLDDREIYDLVSDCQCFHEGEYSLQDFYKNFDGGGDHDEQIEDLKERFYVTDLNYIPAARQFFKDKDEYMVWITSDREGYREDLDDEADELVSLCDETNKGQSYDQICNGGTWGQKLEEMTEQYIKKCYELDN